MLANFVLYTYPSYKMGWVHEEICLELDAFLEAVVQGTSPRLMITMPPRHGKSELATRRFPAYAFGRHPDLSVISTSYSADLSSRMNRDVQRIMDNPLYQALFPETLLSGKNIRTVASGSYLRNSDIFEIVGHKGSYRSSGVGGGITGMGGDILIVDDPFKDRAEADSPTIRNKVWDWYTSTLYTRLAPGGGILIINTRWHLDDLSGRLIKAEGSDDGDKWRKVNFPAIAEHDEERRKQGEPLHPERYSLKQLDKIKAALGTRDWLALYQQRPVQEGGNIFKEEWIKRWNLGNLPEFFDELIFSWDMTFKDTTGSDFVVGQTWGRKGPSYFLLHQVRARMAFIASKNAVKTMSLQYPQGTAVLIEDKANGPAVIDALRGELPGLLPVEPDGSKISRANAVSALVEAGNVYIPEDEIAHPWVPEYIAEMISFPAGPHDDQQVDATTQALRHLKSHGLSVWESLADG